MATARERWYHKCKCLPKSDFSVIGTQVHDTNACFLKMILLFENVEETDIYRLGIANFWVSIHVKPFEKWNIYHDQADVFCWEWIRNERKKFRRECLLPVLSKKAKCWIWKISLFNLSYFASCQLNHVTLKETTKRSNEITLFRSRVSRMKSGKALLSLLPAHLFVQRFVSKIPRLDLWYNYRHWHRNLRRISPLFLATYTSYDLAAMAAICCTPGKQTWRYKLTSFVQLKCTKKSIYLILLTIKSVLYYTRHSSNHAAYTISHVACLKREKCSSSKKKQSILFFRDELSTNFLVFLGMDLAISRPSQRAILPSPVPSLSQ